MGVGVYKQSFTSEKTKFLKLAEVYFESEGSAASFEKRETEEVVLGKVSNHVLLRASLRKYLSDTYSSRK